MNTVLCIVGTRPEAIKMAPLVKALDEGGEYRRVLLSTGQHGQLTDDALRTFSLRPDRTMHIMRPNQSLNHIMTAAMTGIDEVLASERPDWVVVQGDTTTTLAGALSAFDRGIRVVHVEAGLRTGDLRNPFPEEANRRITDLVSTLMAAPTRRALDNLRREGQVGERAFVTGNTGIDALGLIDWNNVHPNLPEDYDPALKTVLLTLHRRESRGRVMEDMLAAIRRVIASHPDLQLIWPMHPAPPVRRAAHDIFDGVDRVHLVEPMDYVSFHAIMSRSYLILTDSGGVEEEAPSFHVPVLVLRKETERQEGVDAGVLRLTGCRPEDIERDMTSLLDDHETYLRISGRENPFGDGQASRRIIEAMHLMDGKMKP